MLVHFRILFQPCSSLGIISLKVCCKRWRRSTNRTSCPSYMYKTVGLDGQLLLSSRVSLWVKIISRCAKTLSIYFVYLTFVYFWSERIDVFEKFLLVFTYNLLFWRSIVTCNRCNIVSSHKCLTYTNQTFCTMSFSRKLIKFFGGNISKLRDHVCFNFCVDVARILKLAPY